MFFVANRVLRDEYLSEDAVHQAFVRIIDNLDKNEEISKILKISEENVRQRISRGKRRLAEILAKEGEKFYE